LAGVKKTAALPPHTPKMNKSNSDQSNTLKRDPRAALVFHEAGRHSELITSYLGPLLDWRSAHALGMASYAWRTAREGASTRATLPLCHAPMVGDGLWLRGLVRRSGTSYHEYSTIDRSPLNAKELSVAKELMGKRARDNLRDAKRMPFFKAPLPRTLLRADLISIRFVSQWTWSAYDEAHSGEVVVLASTEHFDARGDDPVGERTLDERLKARLGECLRQIADHAPRCVEIDLDGAALALRGEKNGARIAKTRADKLPIVWFIERLCEILRTSNRGHCELRLKFSREPERNAYHSSIRMKTSSIQFLSTLANSHGNERSVLVDAIELVLLEMNNLEEIHRKLRLPIPERAFSHSCEAYLAALAVVGMGGRLKGLWLSDPSDFAMIVLSQKIASRYGASLRTIDVRGQGFGAECVRHLVAAASDADGPRASLRRLIVKANESGHRGEGRYYARLPEEMCGDAIGPWAFRGIAALEALERLDLDVPGLGERDGDEIAEALDAIRASGRAPTMHVPGASPNAVRSALAAASDLWLNAGEELDLPVARVLNFNYSEATPPCSVAAAHPGEAPWVAGGALRSLVIARGPSTADAESPIWRSSRIYDRLLEACVLGGTALRRLVLPASARPDAKLLARLLSGDGPGIELRVFGSVSPMECADESVRAAGRRRPYSYSSDELTVGHEACEPRYADSAAFVCREWLAGLATRSAELRRLERLSLECVEVCSNGIASLETIVARAPALREVEVDHVFVRAGRDGDGFLASAVFAGSVLSRLIIAVATRPLCARLNSLLIRASPRDTRSAIWCGYSTCRGSPPFRFEIDGATQARNESALGGALSSLLAGQGALRVLELDGVRLGASAIRGVRVALAAQGASRLRHLGLGGIDSAEDCVRVMESARGGTTRGLRALAIGGTRIVAVPAALAEQRTLATAFSAALSGLLQAAPLLRKIALPLPQPSWMECVGAGVREGFPRGAPVAHGLCLAVKSGCVEGCACGKSNYYPQMAAGFIDSLSSMTSWFAAIENGNDRMLSNSLGEMRKSEAELIHSFMSIRGISSRVSDHDSTISETEMFEQLSQIQGAPIRSNHFD
jgi:hypothetical protein